MRNMKLLVVGNHSSRVGPMTDQLVALGHDVTVAHDETEARECLRRDCFAMVISDWSAPGLDGPKLCRDVRALPNAAYVYFLLLLPVEQVHERLKGLAAGADDFLPMPWDPI